MEAIHVLGLLVLFTYAEAEICVEDVCEQTFELHRSRTMQWKGSWKYYDVKMNGTDLQVIANRHNVKPDASIGKIVNKDEVITADGFKRTVITINGQFPGPAIEVMEGAQVVVHVVNKLHVEGVTIHWHGITMRGSPWMDGVPNFSQCAIQPGQRFTYRFIAEPAGTHWYHSHVIGQRADGLFGIFIVHARLPPPSIEEFPLLVGDWTHIDGKTLKVINPTSADPLDMGSGESFYAHANFKDFSHDYVNAAAILWQSALINGRGRHGNEKYPLTRFNVTRGRTYRFRMANVGAEYSFKISVDSHILRVVALDGHDIDSVDVDFIFIDPGESIDFEMTANHIEGLYWLRAESVHDYKVFQTFDGKVHDVKAVVVYEGMEFADPKSDPITCTATKKCIHFNCPFGSFPPSYNKVCVNIDDVTSKYSAEDMAKMYGVGEDDDIHEVFLNIGYNFGSAINSRKMLMPSAPLYQKDARIVSCDDECKDRTKGCHCTNLIPIPFNKTIQIVFSNYQPVPYVGHHPMHVHGHTFAVLHTGFANHDKDTGRWVSYNSDVACDDDSTLCAAPRWNITRPVFQKTQPAIKDTVHVPARGYAVIRFKSTNPGFWLFHCHMDHHVDNGMAAALFEGDGYIPPPPENMPTCRDFSYSEKEFAKQLTVVNDFKKGSGGKEYFKVEGKDEEMMGNPDSSMKNDKREGNMDVMDKACRAKEGYTMIRTGDLIGCIIGCIVIGFIIALIPLYIYIKCGGKSKTKPEEEPKSRF